MATKIFLIVVLSFAINCNVTTAIALNCEFGMIPPEDEIYECSATLLIETRNSAAVIAIFGEHQSGKGNADVRGLAIRSEKMEFFPVNIENFFPNLEVINFTNNSISSFSNSHLNPFPNLSVLGLENNRVSSLDSNVFSGLNSLQFIQLGGNFITSLDSNLFVGLKSQGVIVLSDNSIMHVGHDFFIPKFTTIWLKNNPCVDTSFTYSSDDNIEEFKFDLLIRCPPTISLIESNLESRPNFLRDLLNRVRILEKIIENWDSHKIYDRTSDIKR